LRRVSSSMVIVRVLIVMAPNLQDSTKPTL
jgi:hypothetical protein